MDDHAESLRKLREEVVYLRGLVESLESADLAGSVAILCQTTTITTYPTSGAVGRVFALAASDISGVETEGASASFSGRPGVFLAANCASGLPAASTYVVAAEVGGTWVFQSF